MQSKKDYRQKGPYFMKYKRSFQWLWSVTVGQRSHTRSDGKCYREVTSILEEISTYCLLRESNGLSLSVTQEIG